VGHHVGVIGVAIIVVVLVIAIPVAVLVSGAFGAGILGFFLRDDAEERYEGTEYLEMGR
jgi:hypothetical protein